MESNKPTRRSLLGAIGGSLALAGCTGGDDDNGEENGGASSDDSANGDDGAMENGEDGANGDDESNGDDSANGGDGMENGDDGGNGEMDAASVTVSSHDEYGDILVGSDGLTLYMFDQDEQGAGESACGGGCADSWPPLTVDGDAAAGDGVSADLTTFERGDGSTQVAANGWPLYYWVNDEEPGDTDGQGVNDVWWVLDADGTPIRGGGNGGDDGDGGGGNGDGNSGDNGGGNGDDDDGGYGGGGGYG